MDLTYIINIMMQVMATISEQSDPATEGFEISAVVEPLITTARSIKEAVVIELTKTAGRISQSSNLRNGLCSRPQIDCSPTLTPVRSGLEWVVLYRLANTGMENDPSLHGLGIHVKCPELTGETVNTLLKTSKNTTGDWRKHLKRVTNADTASGGEDPTNTWETSIEGTTLIGSSNPLAFIKLRVSDTTPTAWLLFEQEPGKSRENAPPAGTASCDGIILNNKREPAGTWVCKGM